MVLDFSSAWSSDGHRVEALGKRSFMKREPSLRSRYFCPVSTKSLALSLCSTALSVMVKMKGEDVGLDNKSQSGLS